MIRAPLLWGPQPCGVAEGSQGFQPVLRGAGLSRVGERLVKIAGRLFNGTAVSACCLDEFTFAFIRHFSFFLSLFIYLFLVDFC